MMQQGEKYQCTNEECGCEISVTRASQLDEADQNPTCCCGEEMERMEAGAKSAAGKSATGSGQETRR
jgi:hypothetical protein